MQDGNVSAGVVEVSKIRAIRKAAGLTQVQLSQIAGVSRFRLCMAESASLALRPDELEAINRALAPEMERAARIASEFRNAMMQHQESSPAPEPQPSPRQTRPATLGTRKLVGETPEAQEDPPQEP